MHQQHQDGGVQGFGAVDGELLQSLHLLSLLHHHKLPFRHHGEAAGTGDYLGSGHIGPVADGLVEVFLVVLQAVIHYRLADEFGVVGLIPHQQIYRGEYAVADIRNDVIANLCYIYSALGHICTKIQKIMITFVG